MYVSIDQFNIQHTYVRGELDFRHERPSRIHSSMMLKNSQIDRHEISSLEYREAMHIPRNVVLLVNQERTSRLYVHIWISFKSQKRIHISSTKIIL